MIFKAVILDMDGVIVDSEALLVKYWCAAAREFGFPMEMKHALEIRSLAGKLAEPLLKSYFGKEFDYRKVRARRIELMEEHIEKYGLKKKPGVDNLLDYLQRKKIKRAVATSTDYDRAYYYLHDVLGIYDRFNDVFCGPMVENGKPAPDLYLYAAKTLDIEPEECMAVEDSPNGITSAYRAGMRPVMVPDLTPCGNELRKMLYCECKDLTGVIGAIELSKQPAFDFRWR